jgi:monoterpene epsilon-lactone hydrolase
MLSDEARARIQQMLEARRTAVKLSVTEDRREWEAHSALVALPRGAHFSPVNVDGVHCEWMDMPRGAHDRVLLLLHGGGYTSGSPRTHRKLAANLARFANVRVLMPDYRLAPEHPFPAGLKDALVAYRWLIGKGGRKPEEIVLGGDSAGGGLALSMMLVLREAGAPLPRAAVLLSPWTDLTVSSPSYAKMRKRDPSTTQEGLREAALLYAGKRDPKDPMMSPLFADLRGLPPLLIHVGGDEIMLDDSRLLAERATAGGVDVTYKAWPGLWHTFQHESPEIPEATQALVEIADFMRRRLDE